MNPSGFQSGQAAPAEFRGERNSGADENQQPRRQLLRGVRGAASGRKARPPKIAQRDGPRWWGCPTPFGGGLRAVTVPVPGPQGYVPGARDAARLRYWPAVRVTGERSDDHPGAIRVSGLRQNPGSAGVGVPQWNTRQQVRAAVTVEVAEAGK